MEKLIEEIEKRLKDAEKDFNNSSYCEGNEYHEGRKDAYEVCLHLLKNYKNE